MTTQERGGRRGGRRLARELSTSARPFAAFLLVVALTAPFASPAAAAPQSPGTQGAPAPLALPKGERVHAASVDPADYLPRYPNATVMARTLAEQLWQAGVNTIYVNAYNVKYGAYYLTSYRYNAESDYGQQNLLGKLIQAAHARGMLVIAALYDHEHRGAWEAQPSWRAKTASGADYNPPGVDVQYFLSIENPAFIAWWKGFLNDLLSRNPGLDGVELREPIVNWWGTSADYNPSFTAAFRARDPSDPLGGAAWIRFRELALTGFLKQEIALVHQAGRLVHLTTVASAYGSGRILSVAGYARATGFDLDGVLTGSQRPDAIKIEPIWQQWANLYPGATFGPAWTASGAQQFVQQVAGRASVIVHVELTRWGKVQPTVSQFENSLQVALSVRGVGGVDFFSTSLADDLDAWPAVRQVYGPPRPRPAPANPATSGVERALILYDDGSGVAGATLGLSHIAAVYLANLLGHFDVAWDMQPMRQYRPGELASYNVVFYQGSVSGAAPPTFLLDVASFRGTVVWMGPNLDQLRGLVRLPFHQATGDPTNGFDQLSYGGQTIPAEGSTIVTTLHPGAQVSAWLTGPAGRVPFVMRSGRFWYVAGSPFDSIQKVNGRYLAFADLLHDMLGQQQDERSLAYLRIEGVNPTSDPRRLRDDAEMFAAHHVPFMVAFTPFFVDPVRLVRMSIADRPEMLSALRYVEAKGGSIFLEGDTHQSSQIGTGQGDEFWDPVHQSPIANDGAAFVRGRLDEGLHEMWAVGLHPVGWVTPEYSASPLDYQIFGDYFSLFAERRIYDVFDRHVSQQWAPYVIDSDVFGSRIIPDTLGDIDDRVSDPQRVMRDARALMTVRGGVAGGVLDLSVPPRAIGGLIEGLDRLGFGWLDAATIPSIVRTQDIVQASGGASATLSVPAGAIVERQLVDRTGTLIDSTTKGSLGGRLTVSSQGLAAGSILTMAASTGGARLLAPPPPIDGPTSPLLRFVSALISRGIAAGATVGVVAILLAYILLRATRRRPELAPR